MRLKVKKRKYVETISENDEEDYYVFKLKEVKGTCEVTVKDYTEHFRLGDIVELKISEGQTTLINNGGGEDEKKKN